MRAQISIPFEQTVKEPQPLFDYMIDNTLYEYSCDPWYSEPHRNNYKSLGKLKGQINYKGEIFVVGRHQGTGSSPGSASVVRVRL
jgi:hypothetical protein